MSSPTSIRLAPESDLAPIAGFRFGVEIGGTTVAWFTECSGLGVERTVYPHEEGGVNTHVHQLPDRLKYTSVSLKRGIADASLWEWFQEGIYDGKVRRENVTILLFNTDRSKAKRWNLSRAFPTKWTGPDLKTGDNNAAIETLELVHEGMTITDWT
jgi:phage tail-like protein